MILQRFPFTVLTAYEASRRQRGRIRSHRLCCLILFAVAGLITAEGKAQFNSFRTFVTLQQPSGPSIVSDDNGGSDVIDPIPPNTAFPSFIGGGNFRADAYVDTNAIIGVEAGMSNRLDKLTSSASFSLAIENPSPFPRRMDLGFLIFPGQLRLVGQNVEASFKIDVSVIGFDIADADGFIPRFEAGGTLKTDMAGATTWTNLPFSNDIGLPPDGPSFGLINIPLRAPTLTAFFGPNAEGNITYLMSVTIDATAAATGGGFLEFATANVSDPLMPPDMDAIESITFTEVPEPATVVLALVALVAWQAGRLYSRRRTLHIV
jgi:hypothetical protein